MQAVNGEDASAAGTGAASGAVTGATIGSVVPGVGTAVGAVAGGIIGGVAGGVGSYMGRQKGSRRRAEAAARQAAMQAALEKQYRENEARIDAKIADNERALAGRDADIQHAFNDQSFNATRAGEYTADLNRTAAAINAQQAQVQSGNRLSLLRRGKLGSSTEAEQGAAIDAQGQQQLTGAEDQLGQAYHGALEGRAQRFRQMRLANAKGDPYANDAIASMADQYDQQAATTLGTQAGARIRRRYSRGNDEAFSQTLGSSLSTVGQQGASAIGDMQ